MTREEQGVCELVLDEVQEGTANSNRNCHNLSGLSPTGSGNSMCEGAFTTVAYAALNGIYIMVPLQSYSILQCHWRPNSADLAGHLP